MLRAEFVAQGVRREEHGKSSVGKRHLAGFLNTRFTEECAPRVAAQRKLKGRFVAVVREHAAKNAVDAFEVGARHYELGVKS